MTLEDVGKFIELVYTPMRKDGVRGNPRSIKSNMIAPGLLYSTIECTFVQITTFHHVMFDILLLGHFMCSMRVGT